MPNFDIYGKPIEDCKDFNINDELSQINEDSRDDFNLLPDNDREEFYDELQEEIYDDEPVENALDEEVEDVVPEFGKEEAGRVAESVENIENAGSLEEVENLGGVEPVGEVEVVSVAGENVEDVTGTVDAATGERAKDVEGQESADDNGAVAAGERGVAEIARENLIRLDGVDIFNGGNLILSNVHFEVDRGEFVYIIGKVGSGKSSVIKSLICELPIDGGSAEVCGYNLHKIKNREIPYLRREIGVVFQDFQLLMDRSVNDNLEFVLSATGWKKESDRVERVNEVLEMVGLQTKAHKMPHQLSGGEQQRIAIARALLNNPKLILADEPTGNLDKETAHGIMELLMKIHREEKPAIVMVTHNTELCRDFPGKIMLCKDNSLAEYRRQ